jgi:peptidoglycan hydrolase-like protein with peptidoglycan-binding domain
VAERERARRNPWRDGSPVNAPTRDVTPTWTPAGVLEGAPASTLAQLQTAVGNRGFSSLVAAHVQRQVAVDTGIVGLKARDGIDQGTVDRRPRVTDLQAQLNRRVGAGLSPDGMWGQKTSGAVHRAQLLAGLAVADVIDQALADFLAGGAPATPVRSGAAMLVGLRKGDGLDADKLDVTNRVKFLQTKLGEQGFPTNVDGRWGAKTDAALRAFQTANSLTPGSPIDAATAEALLGAAQTTAIDPGSSSVLVPGVNREERPFGTFVVLPDGKTAADFPTLRLDPTVEVMAAADFARLQALWDELVAGTGTIQIGSIDPDGKAVPAFRDKMLGRLGTLLSRPTGRRVINDIHELGRLLLIAPDRLFDAPRGQPRASGPVTERDTGRGLAPPVGNGLASDSTILMPPDLEDNSLVALDRDGQPLQTPLFEILGHELGHALHNAQGQNRSGEAGSDPSFPNREEENTDDIENAIRAEHGLAGQRFHHGGRRGRATDFQ